MGRYGEGHNTYVGHKKNLAESVEHKEFSQTYRTFLIVYALTLSFLTSGVIFGWPAILIALHREGVYYGSDCPGRFVRPVNGTSSSNSFNSESSYYTSDDYVCESQIERLNLVFVVALAAYFITFFFTNFFLRRFGPRTTCGIGSLLFLIGTLLFAFSAYQDPDHSNFDGFIPGYLLMAIGGPFIVTSFVHLSNLFPNSKSLVITLFNISVDASALCFLFFEILFSYYGYSRRLFFILYSIVPAICLLSLWIWPSKPFTASVLLSSPTLSPPSASAISPSSTSSSNTTDHSESEEDMNPDESAPIKKKNSKDSTVLSAEQGQTGTTTSATAAAAVDRADLNSSTHHPSQINNRDKPLTALSTKSHHSQLSSASSLFLILFSAIFILRLHYYLSTALYQILEISNFNWTLSENFMRLLIILFVAIGIIVIPITQWLLSFTGITFTLFLMIIISLLCNGLWLINMNPGIVWVQIITFILYGMWRGMMMRSLSWYVGVVYGGRGFGRMWGVVMGIVGLISFAIWGLVRIVEDGWGEGKKGWFWMNVIMLGVGAIVGLFFVIWCEYKIRNRKRPIEYINSRGSHHHHHHKNRAGGGGLVVDK